MSSSAFAGNVLLIDMVELQQRGWLVDDDLAPDPGFEAERLNFAAVWPWRMDRLARAAKRFAQAPASSRHARRADRRCSRPPRTDAHARRG